MAMRARASYLRIPPRKARLVVDLVRGKDVNAAATILKFLPNKTAKHVAKLLHSAVSNATQKGDVDVDTLYVREIQVGPGPTLKRFTSRAMGRGARVNRRTSHITIQLGER